MTRPEATRFIDAAVERLMEARGLAAYQIDRAYCRLREALALKIDRDRDAHRRQKLQTRLFDRAADNFEVDPACGFTLTADKYTATPPDKGARKWKRHLFPRVGELKQDCEEHDCAVLIDGHPGVDCWVRNLVKRKSSFWLQTSSDRFYYDFLVRLRDCRTVVAEYKAARWWDIPDEQESLRLGGFWADRSGGRCRFVMPRGPEWSKIDAALRVGEQAAGASSVPVDASFSARR